MLCIWSRCSGRKVRAKHRGEPELQDDEIRQTKLIRPTYSERFRCIGPDCEDTCCQGWGVPVDRAAYEKYQILPASPLRTLLDASIVLTPSGGDDSKPDIFATMRMTGSNRCSLLSTERLCHIQSACGEEFLPHTCATYPRIVHSIGGIEEKALTLSCPEAARLVLLDPNLLDRNSRTIREPFASESAEGSDELRRWFRSIREIVVDLVGNHDYPLWQRLFLIGVFCRRLEAIAQGTPACPPASYFNEFTAMVKSGALRTAMDTLPADDARQLDMVLRVAGMLLHRSNVHARFADCVQAFTSGIGNSPTATLASLIARYTLSHDRYYAPFFERHPHIFENYLINTIFRCEFPFGRSGRQAGTAPSPWREFARLTAKFALTKGLLIGVAGHHGEAFCAEHVVHTVQAASKHFEHHAEFLDEAHTLLKQRHMDGALGLAMLLRNERGVAARPKRGRAAGR